MVHHCRPTMISSVSMILRLFSDTTFNDDFSDDDVDA